MRLTDQVKAHKATLAIYEEHIDSLNRYLNSSKFDIDTMVQVGDISLRLSELRLDLLNNWDGE